MKITPTLEECKNIAAEGSYGVIPISTELYADMTTPIEVLRILKKVSGHVYLLESAEADKRWGRYSFLGYDPLLEITCYNGKTCLLYTSCGASGYFFVNYVFQTSMERETRQALDESSILRFAFETAALNIPSKYDVLPDGTVEQIGVYLENSGQHGNRLLRISDENGKVLYVSEGFTGDTSLWRCV